MIPKPPTIGSLPPSGLCQQNVLACPNSEVAQCMLDTIRNKWFYIRIAQEDSASYYSTITTFLLILGVLQGSGAAPSIWFCLSCVLLAALQTYSALPASLQTAPACYYYLISQDVCSSPNWTLSLNQDEKRCPVTRTSGGVLALRKCFYYMIE